MNQTVTCDAVRLEGAQRLTFLPDLFGGDFMTSEASVYAYAQRYCPEYQGGFWQFYRLPDGGGFMAPDVESLTLCNPDINGIMFRAFINAMAKMMKEKELKVMMEKENAK